MRFCPNGKMAVISISIEKPKRIFQRIQIRERIMAERSYKIDNIRCILIFCVVLGHLIEFVDGAGIKNIYKIIYSFHVPAFIFITGYLSSFKPKKIVLSLIYPYCLFQILYIIFNKAVLNNQIELQFTTPHWLLWYLFAIIAYYCMIPLIKTDRKGVRTIITLLSFAVSVLAGVDDSVGRYLSLSRILTFLPFFVIGYYMRHSSHADTKKIHLYDMIKKYRITTVLLSFISVVLASCYICSSNKITKVVLYCSYSYDAAGYTPAVRMAVILIAFCWLLFLWRAVPEKKICIISSLGANTLPIYLLHGFAVYMIRTTNLFSYSEVQNLLLAACISILMMLLFGNRLTAAPFRCACTGNWIFDLYEFCSEKAADITAQRRKA